MQCSEQISLPLSQLIHQSTQGNPLFVTQFFQGLYEDGHISFDIEARAWQCDFNAMKLAVINPNILEFMLERLAKLPDATQELIKLASCIGFQFDLPMLSAIAHQEFENVTANLLPALQQGFLLSNSGHALNLGDTITPEFRFLHDRFKH